MIKTVLIAVDDTKGSKSAITTCTDMCKCIKPEAVVLVYVEKFEGRSLMDEMLGDAEMSTLKDVLEGTEYKKKLDEKAGSILGFYKKILEENGVKVKSVVKHGHPAEGILSAAKDEKADMIIVGSRGKRVSRTFMGSVSREVANNAEIPVMIIK